MSETILIKGGTIVTMDEKNSIVRGDVLIRDGRIAELGRVDSAATTIIDAEGCAVLPGFVQTHIHLCQTLFRGAADDLSLIDWLKKRVWPMEAAHTAESIRASARLGVAEMIRGGTTCALTMETVRFTEEVLRVVEETGFRATVGKCMMDKGDDVPAELHEQTQQSIRESVELIEKWHGRAGGRVRCCFAPRFAISCTRQLLTEVSELSRRHQVLIHTHASENKKECEIVEAETGRRNVAYLDSLGISGAHVLLAHCVHLDGFAACGRRGLQQPARHVHGNAHRGAVTETCSRTRSSASPAGPAHGYDRWGARPGSGKRNRQSGGGQAGRRDCGQTRSIAFEPATGCRVYFSVLSAICGCDDGDNRRPAPDARRRVAHARRSQRRSRSKSRGERFGGAGGSLSLGKDLTQRAQRFS